jgi:hypothetical protein
MVAKPGDPGFVDGRTSLVKIAPGRLPAMITAKKPIAGNGCNMANWVVHNAARHGVLANDYFYKYLRLEHAEGAKLKGTARLRSFTIEEVTVRSGWWKQIPVTGVTKTVLPDHLRFRLPDNGQGA